ncbi:hypothetical protein Cadr_000014356 [Camelus dromedarius]|uniref:Uncharacterized protein n=1 Tax=Camelus dromedarius TaxID=9838 RepID=A0A5N4DLW7_CAMDR|nr:hypothetical protein Cadr_000014356 [Camelus dromedarius]
MFHKIFQAQRPLMGIGARPGAHSILRALSPRLTQGHSVSQGLSLPPGSGLLEPWVLLQSPCAPGGDQTHPTQISWLSLLTILRAYSGALSSPAVRCKTRWGAPEVLAPLNLLALPWHAQLDLPAEPSTVGATKRLSGTFLWPLPRLGCQTALGPASMPWPTPITLGWDGTGPVVGTKCATAWAQGPEDRLVSRAFLSPYWGSLSLALGALTRGVQQRPVDLSPHVPTAGPRMKMRRGMENEDSLALQRPSRKPHVAPVVVGFWELWRGETVAPSLVPRPLPPSTPSLASGCGPLGQPVLSRRASGASMLQQQLEGLSQEGWYLLAGRSWGNRHPPLKAPTPNWFLGARLRTLPSHFPVPSAAWPPALTPPCPTWSSLGSPSLGLLPSVPRGPPDMSPAQPTAGPGEALRAGSQRQIVTGPSPTAPIRMYLTSAGSPNPRRGCDEHPPLQRPLAAYRAQMTRFWLALPGSPSVALLPGTQGHRLWRWDGTVLESWVRRLHWLCCRQREPGVRARAPTSEEKAGPAGMPRVLISAVGRSPQAQSAPPHVRASEPGLQGQGAILLARTQPLGPQEHLREKRGWGGGHRQPWCTSGLADPPGSPLLAGESRADSTGPMRKAKQERPKSESASQHIPQLHHTPQNKIPYFPLTITPTSSPFPMGALRAAASFVEIGTSSGTWEERGRDSQGPGHKRPRPRDPWEMGGWDSQPARVLAQGSPGDPMWKDHGKVLIQPRERAGPGGDTNARGGWTSLVTMVSSRDGPRNVRLRTSRGPGTQGPPYPVMSCRACSSGFSWYSMPCLAHKDLTSGATLCKLCRGIVGKRLGRAKCLSPPLAYTEASQAWEPCPSPSPHVPTGWGRRAGLPVNKGTDHPGLLGSHNQGRCQATREGVVSTMTTRHKAREPLSWPQQGWPQKHVQGPGGSPHLPTSAQVGLGPTAPHNTPHACAHWCSIWKLRCPLNQSLKKDCSTLQVADSLGGSKSTKGPSPSHKAQPYPGLTALPRFPTSRSKSFLPPFLAQPCASQHDAGPRTWISVQALQGPVASFLATLTWLLNHLHGAQAPCGNRASLPTRSSPGQAWGVSAAPDEALGQELGTSEPFLAGPHIKAPINASA